MVTVRTPRASAPRARWARRSRCHGPGAIGREPAADHHLRTDFIARAANTNAAVHYDIRQSGACGGEQALDADAEDPPGGAAPARVQQRDAPARHHEVDRDAVGDRHREQDPALRGDPAVHTLDLDPSPHGAYPLDDGPVDLVAEHHGVESGEAAAERPPAAHRFADGRVRPEAQVEPAARIGAPSGDPGEDPVAGPFGDFEEREWPGGGRLAQSDQAAASVIRALDLRAERAEAFVDALVPALDLAHVVDGARAFGRERGEEHRHAGPDVGRLDHPALER